MRRKIDLLVAFVLIAGVIVMVAIGWHNSRSARGDDAATAASSYDVGPYGTPLNQIPQPDPWGLNNLHPLVHLKDLPPLPPLCPMPDRAVSNATPALQATSATTTASLTDTTNAAGTTAAQSTNYMDNLSPDLQAKIAQLKARKAPWDAQAVKGGN